MRNLLLTILLALFTLSTKGMSRAEADSLAVQGERAYSTGDYSLALHYFDSIRGEFTSSGLLLNVGNCHFKLGDVPRAILHYERALRLEPGAEDVRSNLELARQQVTDRVNELPGFALGSTWGRVRGGRDIDQWARWSLWGCAALFAALAAGLIIRHGGLRRGFLALAAMFFLFTATSVLFAAVRHAELVNDTEAIIMTPKVDVRSEPRSGSTVLFVLHKGTKVFIQQEQQGWSEIRLANGSVGWMPPSSLEQI